MTDDVATRRWRLRGYKAGDSKNPAVDKTLVGDQALDYALRSLERDPEITRTSVKPT